MKNTGEFGADLKYGVTPSLTLDLTYNTDFAQVEVDEQRTNLTRFPLFFPEKRPFFLENAGVFSAGTPQAVGPLLHAPHRHRHVRQSRADHRGRAAERAHGRGDRRPAADLHRRDPDRRGGNRSASGA